MAIFVAQARVRITLLQIDQPSLDAKGNDMLLRNGVAGTVELADIAVHAEVLDAELAGLVFGKGQVRRDEAGAKNWRRIFR
jgi:hypothetical protein